MIRAAISRTFLRKDEQERLSPARQQRTLRTSKTALFQAVLGESYHSTYGRAVLALVETYPAYTGCQGMVPGFTALSDWLCQVVADRLVKDFPSETPGLVENGSPHLPPAPPTQGANFTYTKLLGLPGFAFYLHKLFGWPGFAFYLHTLSGRFLSKIEKNDIKV